MEIANKNKCSLSFEKDVNTVLITFLKESEYNRGEGDDEVWTDEVDESFEIDMEKAKELRDLLNRIIK